MKQCEFCEKEFESKQDMHIHWIEEHEDELNSHQRDKAKKAERKRKERKEAEKKERKKKLGYGAAGAVGVIFIGFLLMQLLQGSGSTTFSQSQLQGQPMLGDENASVTVVEFSDHKCPYCREFKTGERSGPDAPANEGVYEKLKKDFIDTGEIKFYVVNMPLHDGATQIASATECVYQQDKEQYWDYNYAVFADRYEGGESVDYLVELAKKTTEGLDYEEMRSCVANGEKTDEVQRDLEIAKATPGPTVTPKIFVNGEYVEDWRYSNLKSKIESELR